MDDQTLYIPDDETQRLEALEEYGLMDTGSEESFDYLTDLLAHLLDVPIALITLVAEERQWFKSRFGLDREETDREDSFCQYALDNSRGDLLVVRDAREDPRFRDNPLVTGEPGLRAYAGAPLVTEDGHVLGTLCALDRKPRDFTPAQLEHLRNLAEEVMEKFEYHRTQDRLTELLRDSELRKQRLDLILDQLPTVTMVCDRELKVLEIRGQALSKLNFPEITPEDDRAVSLEDLLPGDSDWILDRFKKSLSGEPARYEVELSGRHFQVYARPFTDDEGRIVGVVATGMDITEQTELHRELREQKERFQEMAETIDEAFWISDPSRSEFHYVSPAFGSIWGYSVEEVLRDPERWFTTIHPNDRGAVDRDLSQRVDESMYEQEYRIQAPSGQTRYIHEKAFPIRQQGELVRIVGVAKDISGRVERERKIRQQEKLASIGEMAAGVMHEINNPNGYIQGNAEYLRKIWDKLEPHLRELEVPEPLRSAVEDDIPEALRGIYEGSLRIENIVENVKGFAREGYESGDASLSIDRASQILEQTLAESRDRYDAEIVREKSPTRLRGSVPISEEDLKSTFTNLIENADDATAEVENPSIQVGMDRSEGRVRFWVEDNGHGISEPDRSRITDPFFSTKNKAEGTGLGLAIIASIVERAEGELTVDSKPEQGTRIEIELPVLD